MRESQRCRAFFVATLTLALVWTASNQYFNDGALEVERHEGKGFTDITLQYCPINSKHQAWRAITYYHHIHDCLALVSAEQNISNNAGQ